MNKRVVINGLGRNGRAILKLVIDDPSIDLVAVNDLGRCRESRLSKISLSGDRGVTRH